VSVKVGVKHICAYVPLDLYEQLLKIKAETGKSMNDIIYEALLKAYGKQEGEKA
jgi:predicted CopG family antitoxin